MITSFLMVSTLSGNQDYDSNLKEKFLSKITHQIIDKWQYSPKEINDEYSELVYKLYLDKMDYDKKYFLLDDIIEFDNYASKLDNLMLDNNTEFFDLVVKRWKERISSIKQYINNLELNNFDFNKKNEFFYFKGDNRDYLKSIKSINDDWRKRIKFQVLRKYWGLFSVDYDSTEVVFDGTINNEILKEAWDSELRTINRRLDRLINQNRDELFSIYINAHSQTFDPHTSYFMPENKEDFDISISGRLEGIGARLSEDDGFIKVVDIIPGGAAWQQGDLEIDDLVIEVAQGSDEAVNVVDWRVRDAVKLIRGKMGSEVTLTIKRDNSLKKISIIRDIVIIEDTYSKSLIFNHKLVDHKVGYITLPKFYHDFRNQGGRNSADDIRLELEKLVEENVDGIIFDLRNNGGGALEDVVKMAGFFINEGPIVQVNGRNNRKKILADVDENIIYDGPLVVLVNQYSASASEIFASALQDYGRAVIVGSSQTFGKGTVQRFINMDQFLPKDKKEYSPMGSLKLTVQKFYRVDGGSTQFNGVSPDIILPFTTDYKEIGEKSLDYALEWDQISKAEFQMVDRIELDYSMLSENSYERVQNSPFFTVVKQRSSELEKRGDQSEISLNLPDYIEEQIKFKKDKQAYTDLLEELERFDLMEVYSLVDLSTLDERSQKKEEEFNSKLQKDYYLNEGIFVLNDMINIIQDSN